MGLKAGFTAASFKKELDKIRAQHDRVVYNKLNRVGLQFVVDARSNNTYIDQTGNLRNSIGYILLKDGKVGNTHFEGDGEGAEAGQKVAHDIAAEFPKGLVLIVVAGMSYAAAVEAKGYDVITNGAFAAEDALKKFQTSLK